MANSDRQTERQISDIDRARRWMDHTSHNLRRTDVVSLFVCSPSFTLKEGSTSIRTYKKTCLCSQTNNGQTNNRQTDGQAGGQTNRQHAEHLRQI